MRWFGRSVLEHFDFLFQKTNVSPRRALLAMFNRVPALGCRLSRNQAEILNFKYCRSPSQSFYSGSVERQSRHTEWWSLKKQVPLRAPVHFVSLFWHLQAFWDEPGTPFFGFVPLVFIVCFTWDLGISIITGRTVIIHWASHLDDDLSWSSQ